MSSAITTRFVPQAKAQSAARPEVNYLNVAYGVKSWLLTTDHKRIAILYLFTVTFMFFLGGAAATVIRLNLMTPTGELVTADTYNKLFSAHGIIMVWFFLVPVVPTVLGNFLLPLMIGARDLAFPKLNLLSWYIFTIGAAITLWAIVAGGVDTGWTFYTPFSTRSARTNVIPTIIGIFISGFSSILTGLNFIVTMHRMRPRPDLVPHAPFSVGDLRGQHHPGFGHTGPGRGADPHRRRACLGHRHLRPRAGRRSAPVPAPVLVLFAPRGLHHDPAGHGRRHRDHPLLRARTSTAMPSWPRRASASPYSASSCGRTTCSSPGSRCTPP